MRAHDSADAWYVAQAEWRDAVLALRPIVQGMGLTETIKWKQPCYMDGGRNIAIVSWMKAGAVLSLLKGVFVDDPRGRLIQPGQDRSGRYMLFTSAAQVEQDRPYIEGLIAQAIAAERAGKAVPSLPDAFEYVAELQAALDADPALKAAFEALTPGRRRQYNLHFGKANKAATRASRVAQSAERIMLGKGLTDCICGRSKRLPRCDGSHRALV